MGVDNPSGPGRGPETVDKPTTQGSGDKPPADDNGSSSQTPRADSFRRAGWKLEGYGETGTEQRDDRDQQPGGSSSADPTGDKQRAPGAPPAEAGKEPQTGSATDRSGTGTGEGTNTDGRDQDPGTTDTGVTDTSKTQGNGRQPEDPAGRAEPTAEQPKPGVPEAEPAGETATQNGQDSRTRPQAGEPRQTEKAGRSGESNGEQDGKTADKPEPQHQTGTPPADDPASTGQPATRTETLRAKGWQFPDLPNYGPPQTDAAPPSEQQREQDGQPLPQQDAEPPHNDSRPPEHPSTGEGGPPQPEQPGDNAEQPPGPQENRPEGTTDETQTGERNTEPPGTSEQAPPTPDGRSPVEGQTSPPGSPEQPSDKSEEPHTTDNTPGPKETADDGQKPLEAQGGQDPPGMEQPIVPGHASDRPRPADDQARGEDEGTRPGPEVPQSAEPANDTGTAIPDGETGDDAPSTRLPDETTEQGTQIQEPRADSTAPDTGAGDGNDTDNTPPPSEDNEHKDGTQQPHGEEGGDRGRKAENDDGTEQPEATEPADKSTPPDQDPTQSDEREEPGSGLAPQGESSVESEPGRFSGRVKITFDSDGRPLLPDDRSPVEAEVDTRGSGELGTPESDPADRDSLTEDSERSSRVRDVYRKLVTKADETKDSADKFTEPAQKNFERVQPTGQLCGERKNTDHIKAPDQAIQVGHIVEGALGTAILVTEATRLGVKFFRRTRESDHARD